MSRKYRHLKEYEKELIDHINQGHTLRETGEKYGFTYQEILHISKQDKGFYICRSSGICMTTVSSLTKPARSIAFGIGIRYDVREAPTAHPSFSRGHAAPAVSDSLFPAASYQRRSCPPAQW